MNTCALYKADSYGDDELFSILKKHFEVHKIKEDISKNSKVLIKPNLVTDKAEAFSVTTNPRFIYAVIRCLKEIGVDDITVADCPGGALLLFSDIDNVYRRAGYSFLSDYVKLNANFESTDVICSEGFVNKSFNIINAVVQADYIINVPKLKTHNMTCITAGVKNLFGCIPGLQKPAFHAKYPAASDFSEMLVELAETVKPNFTIVDAIDIMDGNGPTNGKRRHLGVTFSSKNVFAVDEFIAETLEIPYELIGTVAVSRRKNLAGNGIMAVGDKDFKPDKPIILPDFVLAETGKKKISAKTNTLLVKLNDMLFMSYPKMNGKCVLCRKCILTCPVHALSVKNGKVVSNKKTCIGCMCCDEVCPNAAVDIKRKIKRKK